MGPEQKSSKSGGKAVGIAADGQLDARSGIEDAGAGDRVGDSVLEFGVAEADAVGESCRY